MCFLFEYYPVFYNVVVKLLGENLTAKNMLFFNFVFTPVIAVIYMVVLRYILYALERWGIAKFYLGNRDIMKTTFQNIEVRDTNRIEILDFYRGFGILFLSIPVVSFISQFMFFVTGKRKKRFDGEKMKLDRTSNFTNNLKWGLVYRFSGILIPFVCKAAIIRIFGVNYIGLNSLFSSIISALNLAELGFGSAVVFFMYKAIAEDDTEKICALLNYYKKVYKAIGLIILMVGLTLMPFLPYLIKKDVPSDVNIYVIYIITLAATVVSYFLYAYKNSILTAYQRESVLYKIRAIVLVSESVLQIVSIFVFENYYAYLFVTVIAAIANNIVAANYVNKHYPAYVPNGKISKAERHDIGNKIKGLVFYKIGGSITNSMDSIVISAYLGLTVAGMYGNYYYVVTLLYGILAVYYTSFRAGLGNSSVLESRECNYDTFKQLQFMQNWLISWCVVCLLCLFQDFINLYAGAENVMSTGVVVCLCAKVYAWKIQDVVHVYKEANGYWVKDRYRPLVGGIIMLLLSLVLVRYIGVGGVALSAALVTSTLDLLWAPKALFAEYFQKSRKEYYIILGKGLGDLLVMCIPTYFIASYVNTGVAIVNLMIKGALCIIVPNILFIIKNHNKSEFKQLMRRVERVIDKFK